MGSHSNQDTLYAQLFTHLRKLYPDDASELADAILDGEDISAKMTGLRRLGVPYTDDQINAAPAEIEGRTELEALIAYLQGPGIELQAGR